MRPSRPPTWRDSSAYIVFYDAGCELCRRSRAFLERTARGVPMQFVDVNDRAALAAWPQVDPVRAPHEVTLVEPSGQVSSGYEAVLRLLAVRWPELRSLMPFLLLLPARIFGNLAYHWVSTRRHRISHRVLGER